MNLFEVRDMALESGRSVYTTKLLANLINKSEEVANVYMSRLVKKGLAVKLISGKISFIDDDYVIASQLVEPSYISLNSALLFHDIIQQVPSCIECVDTRNTIKYPELGINYHKIMPSLFYGFKRYMKGGSYILIAESEKAVIDGLYLNMVSVEELDDLMGEIDRKRIKELAKRFEGKGSKKMKRLINA